MIGICSDIHGNAEALDAVLGDMEKRGVRGGICLGDVVGYGGDPALCIRRVREAGWQVLAGNHEEGVLYPEILEFFSGPAATSLRWTEQQLSSEDKKWMAELPHVLRGEGAEWVHASLAEPLDWPYILGRLDAREHFARQTKRVCFCGHTHIGMIWYNGRRIRSKPPTNRRFTLPEKRETLINVGSVGQPRDGNTRASYVIYDPMEHTIQFRRIPYDIKAAQKKIRRAGLPDLLAERLEAGF